MATTDEIRIKGWDELQELLFEDAWRPEIQRFRSPYVFRGVNEASHGLQTSLARLGGNYPELERHLLRNFRKYAQRDLVEQDTMWHWMALAKHHGLPTRLLDWSFSPFVAMHFATSNIYKYNQDGVIWAVRYVEAHASLPEKLRQMLGEEGSSVLTVEMLAEMGADLDGLEEWVDREFVLFFEPPSLDERIVNQFALFSMMSSPESSLDLWLDQNPEIYKKIVIPAELKWEIRDKLDQANVTERVLFPGLDGLSAWLKRHYSQRDDKKTP
jgi:hypothetical protein